MYSYTSNVVNTLYRNNPNPNSVILTLTLTLTLTLCLVASSGYGNVFSAASVVL